MTNGISLLILQNKIEYKGILLKNVTKELDYLGEMGKILDKHKLCDSRKNRKLNKYITD